MSVNRHDGVQSSVNDVIISLFSLFSVILLSHHTSGFPLLIFALNLFKRMMYDPTKKVFFDGVNNL